MSKLSANQQLSLGKQPPKLPNLDIKYDEKTRLVVFLPKIAPENYEKIKDIHEAQMKALSSL